MARIALKKDTGPSPWHIMLAGFDIAPEGVGARGLRGLTFTLANDQEIHAVLKGVDWGEYPRKHPWELTGYQADLPKGYVCSGSEPNTIVLKYDPFSHSGEVELDLVSPCHRASLEEVFDQGDNLWEWRCAVCHQTVMRIDPMSGDEQWLNADGKGGEKVGIIHRQEVWISYRRLDAGEDELTVCTSGPNGDVFLGSPDMMPIVPKDILTGIRPVRSPRKECGLYYRLKGNIFGLPPDVQATLGEALGSELMHRLRQIQTAGKELNMLPLALVEPLPPFSAVVSVYRVRDRLSGDVASGDTSN